MAFTFNGIPGTEVTISGGVSFDYSGLLTHVGLDNSTYTFTVPTNKKWVIVGAVPYDQNNSSIYVTRSGNSFALLASRRADDSSMAITLPIMLSSGDKVSISYRGAFSYYEIDA